MKRLYNRHLEISLDGENWEFANFLENNMCYIEEVPNLQKVWKADTYEKAIRLLEGWGLLHTKIRIPIINKRIISIKVPFTGDFLLTEKHMELYIRIKYSDGSQVSMEKLMKYLSNKDFKAWAEDNNLKYFEKSC